MTEIDTLRALEAARCAALVAGDTEALAALLADDLVHVHLNGRSDDRAGYLRGVRDLYAFHSVERGDLRIRLVGTCAVMTGPLIQSLEIRATGQRIDVRATCTQVWQQIDGIWRLNTCHNAPVS